MSQFLINPYAFSISLLLDTYSGAAGAYSLRKLRTAYTGSAIRVRRSNDNTEQDIGFDGDGNLDESALTTFVGANSGFVTTWYDQSGNGRNATQTTSGNQPRIVNSGTVDKVNSKPSIFFNRTNNNWLNTAFSFSSAVSIFNVLNVTGTSGNDRIGVYHNSTFAFGRQALNNWGIQVVSDLAAVITTSPSIAQFTTQILALTANTTYLAYGNWNGNATAVNYARNGTLATASNTSGSNLRTGETGNAYFNGYISESVIYLSNQSTNRTGIETNINGYYSIY